MNTLQTRFGSGQEVRRLEDDALLAGQGVFTDDVKAEGLTRLSFVRSPHPHARIVSIDTSAARAMPGVRLVLTGADIQAAGVKPMAKPIMHKRADGGPPASPNRDILAVDRVRFVGECVAAVVADTEQQARDAAEAVQVDYEPLPHAVTLSDALSPAAPLLSDAPDNRVAESRHGDAAQAQAAFAQARHVVKLDITNQRVAALSIEPRSVQAHVEDGRLVVRMSSQMPTGIRTQICDLIGLKDTHVRVLVGDVGGGFGMKTGAYPEELVVAFCAHRLQQPVKWIADRSEEFLSSCHGRDIECHGELALDAQGKMLALRIQTRANVGAYPSMTGVSIQIMIGPWVQTSVYDMGCIDFHYTAVMTNTAPTGAYRGAGRPEAIYNIERLIDEAARVSGIDRLEIRRRNFIRPEQMPYKNPMGQTYDTGDFGRMMEQGLKVADWSGFEARAAESASRGMWRGLGIATFLEWTGGNALEENVNIRILSDGVIEVFSAVNQMGQGIATSLAQLVVDVFDVPLSQVRVVLGDTDRGNGFGSAGSRSLFTGGSAISVGSRQALDKARELAAEALEAAPADLTYALGLFSVAGTDLKIGLGELAQRQSQGRIELVSKTAASGPTWPNGCHICEVEVDPQTGEVQVVRYSSMNDIGRVVNPMIVRGQLDGGAVQGIGQALLEHMVYDPASGQPVTGSLMDYAAPRADIMPAMFDTHTDSSVPSKNNVLGVKGVGELGTIGATPAVVNAVADALARHGRADLSPQLQMPITASRLWSMLRQGR
ncbi:MAG: xanthine dehydrogenase family protein molybdopterin-binding subunit [Alphaproteobacteria bacterium]|nr:xanthine dehydrogenase family protein molybdopterin-binding subunit [Alphaproteobacteria bacterium]